MMKKRKPRRFAALFLVCLMVLGLIPTDAQRPLYNEGTVNAAEQDFSDGNKEQKKDAGAVPVQTGTVSAQETAGTDSQTGTANTSEPSVNEESNTTTLTDTTETTGNPTADPADPNTTPDDGKKDSGEEEPEVQTGDSDPVFSDALEHNDNSAKTEEEAPEVEIAEDEFSDGGTTSGDTSDKTDETVTEASDGSLAGTAIYFKDTAENSALTGVWAAFDGGQAEAAEVQLQLGEDGYYTAVIPEGDYSRLTFRVAGADGVQTVIEPSYRYYEGQSAMENTQTVLFQKDVLDTYYYAPETNSYWAAREKAEEEPEAVPEETRVTEPSDGSWAGQEMHFVNLYWEDENIGDVYALFQGGESEDQAVLMTQGDRGKYTVTVPEGDYSRVSFAQYIGEDTGADGQDASAEVISDEAMSDGSEASDGAAVSDGGVQVDFSDDATAETTLDENGGAKLSVNGSSYRVLGVSFQYYNAESAAENCRPVAYMPDAFDTYYYDTETPDRSYWGADALYEPAAANAVAMYAASAQAVGDLAGQTLYFVDLTPEGTAGARRVTMQFYTKDHNVDETPNATLMYEGRNGIFSAPIPEGDNYAEVTFMIEYDSTDADGNPLTYTLSRHYNIYSADVNATENPNNENFVFKQGEMDAFFYNNHPENEEDNAIDSYWGPHPSVTDRSLDAQYLYIDTTDRENIGDEAPTFSDLTMSYGKETEPVTLETRNDGVYAFQFPSGCGATEQTVLTLSWTNKTTNETETFRFYYPYNSSKKMIVMDQIRTEYPVFEEFVINETDKIYVMYDNSSTGFAGVQFRAKKDTGEWTEWMDLEKTDPSKWEHSPNSHVVENIYGTEIESTYKYVQFREKPQNGKSYWRTTNNVTEENTLALIPVSEYNFPCFYGVKEGKDDNEKTENEKIINLTGIWMSALDIRDFGDRTVTIPTENFNREDSSYYGTSTFYDYYSDTQIRGFDLATLYSQSSNNINEAIEARYPESYAGDDSNSTKKRIYMNADQASKYTGQIGGDKLKGYDSKASRWSGYWDPYSKNKRGLSYQGLVDEQLLNGQLMQNGTLVPLFDEEFLRGNNVLGTSVGNVYKEVKFPFKKNTDTQSSSYGYWEFDSSKEEEALRIKYDENQGYFLDITGVGIKDNADKYGFFPFNDNENGKNFMFGAHIDIPFTLPEGNEVQMDEKDEDKKPVTFEFSGDDDTWIFVDGKLVLDIGGIHDAITGTINFKTKEAQVKQYEYNNRGNKVDKTETTQFELDDSIENHTLSIYYLERGLGSSNLKLTFNFPKQNTLNVTNDIDTSTANPIFKDALENIGSFAYEIKNQATSGSSLDVEQSAGYVSLGEPLVYDTIGNNSRITSSTNSQGTVGSDGGRDNVLNIQQTTPLNGESSDQEIIDSLVSVQGNADISDKAYLRFSAYNDSDDADSSGESIYVVLCDEDGNRMGGWASRLPYNGSSNSIGSQEWALVRIDINKLQFMNGASTFDRTNVTAVEFATRETTPLYIDQLEFYPAVTEKPSHRFSVGQEEISDYGSIEKKGLSDVDGAWYGHFAAGMTENTYRMVEDGFFAVGDDERAQFVDKFRVGSYLQITQRDIDPDVFSTTWSIREGINPNPRVIPENDLLGSRTDTQTVKNTGKRLTLEEQVTDPETGEPRPDDGRYVPGENGSDTRPEGGSFVYRSYDSPDDNHMNPVHLTVAFKNVLKTGSLTIQKEVQLENNQSAKGAVYEFEVIFTNVAGMGLEDAPIKQTIQVVIGEDGKTGATTFDNIPAGTDYTIRELKASGLELQDIVVGKIHTHEDVAKVEDSDHKPLYGKGTVYSSDQEFKFINKVEPFVMTIEKHWDDAGAEEHRPTEIGIKLWRREAGSETWENVTRTFYDGAIGENEQSYIKLSADNADPNSPNIWRTKTKKLDAVSKNGQTYIYKIEEMNLDTSERWNLNNYKAEYVQGDTETGAYIVINTPNAIEVKKVWEDRNDPSRPVAVRVRLERKLATESDDAYAEPEAGKYTVTLSTNGNPKWAHIFNALERVDSSGKNTYKYRVVETHLINADGTEHPVEKNKETNGYKTSYSENEDNTVLTITNFKGAGKARLIKYDRSDESKKLEGATFILSRLKPLKGTEEENDKNFSIGLGNSNDKYWTIDQNYSQVSYTTNEDGVIDFGFLPYGYYRVVETKAPDGYILDDTPYDFKVTEETMKQIEEKGEEYLEIEVPNKSTITLPISGAAGTFMFTLAGLILVVSAMLLYKLHLQKTRKRIRARAVARKNEREE